MLPAEAMVASVRPWNAPLNVIEPPAFGPAVHVVIAPRQLDGALAGFRARIAEEHLVGERHLAQPLRQPLLSGDAIEVGGVPHLVGLLGQRIDQLGMRVAQRIDGNAAGEIQIAIAVGGDQPGAFAALEHEVGARVGGHHRRRGTADGRLGFGWGYGLGVLRGGSRHGTYLAVENKKAALERGADVRI